MVPALPLGLGSKGNQYQRGTPCVVPPIWPFQTISSHSQRLMSGMPPDGATENHFQLNRSYLVHSLQRRQVFPWGPKTRSLGVSPLWRCRCLGYTSFGDFNGKPKGTSPIYGCGVKSNRRGYAGFGPRFHLPGFQFGTGFLSHSHNMFSTIPILRMSVGFSRTRKEDASARHPPARVQPAPVACKTIWEWLVER